VNAPTPNPYLPGGNPNKFTVGIEHEGFSIMPRSGNALVYSAGYPWPEPLIEASIRVHQWIFGRVNQWNPGAMPPNEHTVITHSSLDSKSRAQDPGDLWLETVRPRIIAALQPAVDLEGAIGDLRAALQKLGG
jgi:hypothetical protein